jgi:hypothetical protein
MKYARCKIFAMALVATGLVNAQLAFAATVRVPSESSNIVQAITSTTSGDTILVAAGTYSYSGFYDLDLAGKSVVLMSEDGPEVTILDGGNSHRIFIAQSSEWRTTLVKGFTFRNGQREEPWGTTGMVRITGSAWINFEDMIFEGGLATNGSAVHVESARANFTNCIFRNNHATNHGAIYLEQANSTLENCLFENNTAGSAVGAALYLGRGTATANNCTFQNNTGGTVYAYWNSGVTLNDCIIRDTTGGLAVVAGLQNTSNLNMNNCLVHDNTATMNGAGGMIQAYGAGFNLTNCTFANNILGGSLSSVLTDTWDSSTITNCVIWGTTGGKALDRCGTVSCSLIFNNDGGDESSCFNLAGDGNQSSDPGFCDPDNRDYRIAGNSPCLPAYSGACGLVGATETGGCTLVATEALNFGSVKALYR